MRRAERPIRGAPKLPPEFFYRVKLGFANGVTVQVRRAYRVGSDLVAESFGYCDHEAETEERLLLLAQMAYGKAVERDLWRRAVAALDPYVGDHREETS